MTYSHRKGMDKSPVEMLAAYQDDAVKAQMLADLEMPELYRDMTESVRPLVKIFDEGNLADFYHKMTEEIREVTADGLIFTENSYFSNMGIESSVQRIRVDGHAEPLQVYSPHGYDLVVDTPAIVYASNQRIMTILDAHKRVQERLDVPVVFGEWGAHGAYEEGLDHIAYILNYFDESKWSHTYYCWENNMTNLPVMKILSRPYPQATAGKIDFYRYDFKNKVFQFKWTEKEVLQASTSLYLPMRPANICFDGAYTIHQEEDGSCIMSIPAVGEKSQELTLEW
ncbi:MAG: cellulase family glycosylhydrolase [Lachnospiraceae bacterium]